METTSKLLASSVALLFACCLHAADSKPGSRVTAILDVETDDPAVYAIWIKQYNEIAKARLNIDNYVRVFQSIYDSRPGNQARAVTSAATVADLMKNAAILDNDPAIQKLRSQMNGIRKTGPRILYKTIRFDGPSPKGAHNYNTLLNITDEPAYLKAVEELRRLFDNNGFKDLNIIVYRTIAGRSNHTHRVAINSPSAERIATMIDFFTSSEQYNQWSASTKAYRTLVANSISRDITKY